MTVPVAGPATVRAAGLVLLAVVSVQVGGAFAARLVPTIGAGPTVVLRLVIGTLALLAIARPTLRGHRPGAWWEVVGFGCALGLMNLAFYAALGRLPIGVAVTVEFVGPLTLAAVLSRRARDLAAVLVAAVGVLLASGATSGLSGADPVGIVLALAAGAFWAGYVLLSSRVGRSFPGLGGLALAMAVATLVVLPSGAADAVRAPLPVLGLGVAIALLSSVVPYSLELVALRSLPERVFGVLLSLEPAAAALAGFVVLGQRLSPTRVIGITLVVAASVAVLGLGARQRTAAAVSPG